jgi:uracil-DNA glycosylase family 4
MGTDPERSRRQARQILETECSFGVEEIPKAAAPDRSRQLAALETEFKHCMNCPLSATRTQVVFGAGSPDAELMFVGEAPGYDEDRQGQPFVGAAGQLLTKIIQAMKLTREQVYIANCLKCRPPGNRNPLPSEIASCNPILERQIAIIRPKVICALGKFAAQTLLGADTPITKLRGRFFEFRDAKLMPTFHPAYLLRNPADKKLVWQDMKLIMKELGIEKS